LPHRRSNLVTEQTRIVNEIKAILARFGIRTFRPTLRQAEERLEQLRTAEGMVLPHNTRAELCRYLARLGVTALTAIWSLGTAFQSSRRSPLSRSEF
jgi:transposase